jgi:hypothetical protein
MNRGREIMFEMINAVLLLLVTGVLALLMFAGKV